jgi:hypothetical protein
MPTVGSEWWELDLAAGWEAEADEYCVTIYQLDGAGALQLSASRRRDGSLVEAKDELARANLPLLLRDWLGDVTCGDFQGYQLVYSENEVFWRKFFLADGRTGLFITYNCNKFEKDLELEAVNMMLASLRSK